MPVAKAKCTTCGQAIKTPHEGPARKRRSRFTLSEPVGEEGVLDDLLIQLVERYQHTWGEMPGVGEQGWKYVALHHALYSLVTASPEAAAAILPSEIGG